MYMKPVDMLDPWTVPARAAFEFWVGLWPIAPIFGVEWRFGDTVIKFDPVSEAPSVAPTKHTARPVLKPVSKPKNIKVNAAAEPAPMPTNAAAEPVVEVPKAAVKSARPVKSAAINPAAALDTALADPDDLTVIKGIGPGLAGQLNGMGIYRLSQIANFSKRDLTRIDKKLTAFKGRCFRDDWVGQAKAIVG